MTGRNERCRMRLTWDASWWGYQDLNLGPLPYQGVDPAVLVALLSL
jgi:hypothetical protein